MAGIVKSGQSVTCVFVTSNPTTGAAVNADSLPTGLIYVNGTVNAASVTVTNITTGVYKAAVTLPSLSAGDVVDLRISATVSTIAGEGAVWSATADTKRVSDLADFAGGAVASVTGAVGSVTGAVGSVTGNVGGNVTGSVGSVTAGVTVTTNNDKTGYTASTVSDKTGYALTAGEHTNIATDAQTGLTAQGYTSTRAGYLDTLNGLVAAIWDKLTSAITTVGSVGKLIKDNLDAAVSSRMATFTYTAPDNADIATILTRTDVATSTRLATSGYTAPDNATITAIAGYVDTEVAAILAAVDTEVAAIKAKTDLIPALPAAVGDIPSAAAIADQVWDEAIAGHVASGTTGAALNAVGVAADPLLATVPGSYASGTAGAALGRIGSGQIVTTSPVAPDGDVTIWAGYDMLAADNYALDWTDTSNVWPVLTGATIAMICRGPSNMSFVGSVVTATGASKKVRVELQDTQTVDMPISNHWVYDVAATLTSGDVIPLVKGGRLYVKAKPG